MLGGSHWVVAELGVGHKDRVGKGVASLVPGVSGTQHIERDATKGAGHLGEASAFRSLPDYWGRALFG